MKFRLGQRYNDCTAHWHKAHKLSIKMPKGGTAAIVRAHGFWIHISLSPFHVAATLVTTLLFLWLNLNTHRNWWMGARIHAQVACREGNLYLLLDYFILWSGLDPNVFRMVVARNLSIFHFSTDCKLLALMHQQKVGQNKSLLRNCLIRKKDTFRMFIWPQGQTHGM